MRVLLVHRQFPGQFIHLARALGARSEHQVVALGETVRVAAQPRIPGVGRVGYDTPAETPATIPAEHPIAQAAIARGRNAAMAARSLRDQGFVPDVILAHTGWGESLCLPEVFPDSPIVGYLEFFYRAQGADVGFDPQVHPAGRHAGLDAAARNAPLLTAMAGCAQVLTPSRWQQSLLPEPYRSRAAVIHDGIDTGLVCPRAGTRLRLPAAPGHGPLDLGEQHELITYVSRNLEPYRGFHRFMQALPALLARRPQARVLILGGDSLSYSPGPGPGFAHWRERMLAEVGAQLDPDRVFFLGRQPYPVYLDLLRLSSVHVHLSYPFVASWSLLEAMSAGCLVVGSRTPPVQELIEDGVNGLLFDFFDTGAMVNAVCRALDERASMAPLRAAARSTIVQRYDAARVCVPAQLSLLDGVARRAAASR